MVERLSAERLSAEREDYYLS